MGHAHNALSLPQSLVESLPQADSHILYRVMLVHLQVPLGAHRQIEEAVEGQVREHMIEEGYPSLDLILTSSLQA